MIHHIINSHHSILVATSLGRGDAYHHAGCLLDPVALSSSETTLAYHRAIPIVSPILLDQGSDDENCP